MPPRTGPRRRKRVKPSPARHFAIVLCDDDPVGALDRLEIAHAIDLDHGHLVLRDEHGAIVRIVAAGEWREARQVTAANPADYSGTDLLPEVIRGPEPEPTEAPTGGARTVEFDTVLARPEEDQRFVPSSPEEAQRILMEIERRLKPDYQDPPDCASDAPPAPRKD